MNTYIFVGRNAARVGALSFAFLLVFLLLAADAQSYAGQTQTTSISAQPAELSPVLLRKLEALKLILQDADSAKDAAQRVRFLNEFMGKSELFLKDNPEATNVWMLRARVAVDLDMAKEGWAAGQRLKALGAEKSNDEEMIRTLAKLERKGWLVEKLEDVKTESSPQNPILFPAEKDGKWGFIDTKGNIVIPMKFEHADVFSEGLAAVKLNGKYGYIDAAGSFVIEPQFDAAFRFTEGIGRVASGLKFEIDFMHSEVEDDFSISYLTANFGVQGEWSFIDKSGKELFGRKFGWAFPFSEGIAITKTGDDWEAIGKSGEAITHAKYQSLDCSFKEGLCDFYQKQSGSDETRCGFIDEHGNVAIEPKFSCVESFSEGLALARLVGSDLCGYINSKGEFVIPPKFDISSGRFSQGLAFVGLPNSAGYGVIDKTGNFVVRPSKKFVTDMGYPFSDGLLPANIDVGLMKREDGVINLQSYRIGFINQLGETVIPPLFDHVFGFKNGLAMVNVGGKKDDEGNFVGGKWGYINKVGRPIWNLDGVMEAEVGKYKTGDYVPTSPR